MTNTTTDALLLELGDKMTFCPTCNGRVDMDGHECRCASSETPGKVRLFPGLRKPCNWRQSVPHWSNDGLWTEEVHMDDCKGCNNRGWVVASVTEGELMEMADKVLEDCNPGYSFDHTDDGRYCTIGTLVGDRDNPTDREYCGNGETYLDALIQALILLVGARE